MNSPRTVLDELAYIQSHDVILFTTTRGEIRLRCVTQPDPPQAALLDRLGIVLPKRMRTGDYYNKLRTHRSLAKDTRLHRIVVRLGTITARPILGDLHHQ